MDEHRLIGATCPHLCFPPCALPPPWLSPCPAGTLCVCTQLLMGASDFCALMHALALLAPGVDGKRFPTVAAYGRFGVALLTSPPDAAAGDDGDEEEQQQERGWRLSPPKGGKKGQKVGCGTFCRGTRHVSVQGDWEVKWHHCCIPSTPEVMCALCNR